MTATPPYEDIYVNLIGFVPPRIQHRLRLERECDSQLLDIIETQRDRAMYQDRMDVKTAQMILFAVLLANLAPAAKLHARAAMRAGATKKELHDVAALTFLFRGLSALNMASEIINELFDEAEAAKTA